MPTSGQGVFCADFVKTPFTHSFCDILHVFIDLLTTVNHQENQIAFQFELKAHLFTERLHALQR